jgi:hypothetical protein
VSSDDLASILELDDSSAHPGHPSVLASETGVAVRARVTPVPSYEIAIVDAINAYIQAIRSSEHLPEYWQYHLTAFARTLRILVAATPAEWSEIQRFGLAWSASVDEKWSSLRPSAIVALAGLREAESRVLKLINDAPDGLNSRAAGLVAFLSETGTSYATSSSRQSSLQGFFKRLGCEASSPCFFATLRCTGTARLLDG